MVKIYLYQLGRGFYILPPHIFEKAAETASFLGVQKTALARIIKLAEASKGPLSYQAFAAQITSLSGTQFLLRTERLDGPKPLSAKSLYSKLASQLDSVVTLEEKARSLTRSVLAIQAYGAISQTASLASWSSIKAACELTGDRREDVEALLALSETQSKPERFYISQKGYVYIYADERDSEFAVGALKLLEGGLTIDDVADKKREFSELKNIAKVSNALGGDCAAMLTGDDLLEVNVLRGLLE